MKPKSESLFHFTRNVSSLKGILEHGFAPRFCLEDVHWIYTGTDHFVAYPMVCFCDIPLSRIDEHTAFYGSYGLGMTKRWALLNSLSPVFYSPVDSPQVELAKFLLREWSGTPDEPEEALERKHLVNAHFYNLLTRIKPLSGKMMVGGGLTEKDFYQESEWRYVPPGPSILQQANFATERDKANETMLDRTLRFSPADVRYILVKEDHEIPDLVDFIMTKLGTFSHNELKVLQTRIFSLQSLSLDL